MRSPEDRDAVHALRQDRLFRIYHAPDTPWFVPYDRAHPDDVAPRKPVYVLEGGGGHVLATARLDLRGSHAVVRLVAVAAEAEGRGLGRALMEGLEAEAASLDVRRLCLNAQGAAEGFYRRLGWAPSWWPSHSADPRSIPMTKWVARAEVGERKVRAA